MRLIVAIVTLGIAALLPVTAGAAPRLVVGEMFTNTS